MSGTLSRIGTTVGNVAGTASGTLSAARSTVGTLGQAVGMLNGSVGAMGGLANLSGLGGMSSAIAATLAEAKFRGVTFSMAASEDELGRRVVQMFFPGIDDYAFQDLGQNDGPIHIRGLICGDDYVYRAAQMRAALLAKGPATLVHPWWGELKVRLVGEPARIGFDETQQGVATLQMTVLREPAPKKKSSGFLDSLSKLLDKADSMLDQATNIMRQVLSPLLIGVALTRSIENSIAQVAAMFAGLIGDASEPIATACATPLASLSAGIAQPLTNTGTTYADAVTDALVAVPVAIANAVLPAASPAVAPGLSSNGNAGVRAGSGTAGGVATLVAATSVNVQDYLGQIATRTGGGALTLAPTPQAGTALLIAAVQGCLEAGASVAAQPGCDAARAITLVAAVGCMTQAIATTAAIQYASRQDALATRDALVSALDALAAGVVAAAAVTQGNGIAPAAVADLYSAIQSTRAATYADMSAQSGRLPSIVSVTVPREMSVWTLAYALAGDTPDQVATAVADLVVRNAISQPAIVPAGTVDVLEALS